MVDLEGLISNTYNTLVTSQPTLAECPLCRSENITSNGIMQTLVGSNNKYDVNHHWHHYSCWGCHENITLEYQGLQDGYNWWVTHKGYVISGISSCWEKLMYRCKCGGTVKHTYKDIHTDEVTSTLGYDFSSGKKNYYECWDCDTCNQGVRID